jgi:hypothetical protein
MAETYTSSFADGAAVDAALGKAESAVQPQSGTATKLTLTLSAGTSCLLSGFDMHGEIDAFGSDQEYIK